MPYVPNTEALNEAAVDITEVRRRSGSGAWRKPIVGSGALRVVLLSWEPRYETVPHIHPRAEEVFHVLEGRAAFRIGNEEERIVGPGTVLLAPRGTQHAIRVVGDTFLLMLIAVAPNDDTDDETIE
jgi:quercetin dioxygenase-like cupin family protein